MSETIQLAEVRVDVTRKNVKNVHLAVHPPDGRVTLVAPESTRIDVARAYVASKIGWIRNQREKLSRQARETKRQFVERESHYLWGRRYLFSVEEAEKKPSVRMDHRRILLTVRPKSTSENLNLTIVNNNGSKCPAVGRYSSTEFCVVWHGFVFNLLLGEIAKNLTPDEMARSLLNVPIKGPRSIQREAGKLAKDIMGGLFGGLLGLDKKK